MLTSKEKVFLNKEYPLISSMTVLSLLPALISALFFSLFYANGKLWLIRDDVIPLVGTPIFFASLISFLFVLCQRHQVRKKCIAVTKGLAIRAHKTKFDAHSYVKISQFSKEIAVYDVVGMVWKTLSSVAAIPYRKNLPFIFVTIRGVEEMYSEHVENYFSALLKFQCRGIQKENWGEVVWSGFRSRARKSLLYEVAFVILGTSKAKHSQEKRHEIIRDFDVEYILEAKK